MYLSQNCFLLNNLYNIYLLHTVYALGISPTFLVSPQTRQTRIVDTWFNPENVSPTFCIFIAGNESWNYGQNALGIDSSRDLFGFSSHPVFHPPVECLDLAWPAQLRTLPLGKTLLPLLAQRGARFVPGCLPLPRVSISAYLLQRIATFCSLFFRICFSFRRQLLMKHRASKFLPLPSNRTSFSLMPGDQSVQRGFLSCGFLIIVLLRAGNLTDVMLALEFSRDKENCW